MYRQKDTLLDYKKAIKDKFKTEQEGDFASFFVESI